MCSSDLVPKDNPFVGKPGYLPEIYTLGHRSPLGLAVHPVTGEIWECEDGPNGGDELNILVPGGNYGYRPDRTPGIYDESVPMTDPSRVPGAIGAVWSSGAPTLATPAPWFNEGHAALFESSAYWRGTLRIEESPVYAPIIEALARKKDFSVQRVLRMDYPDFYAGGPEALQEHYALAYALVYYLNLAAAPNPRSPFRDTLKAYVRSLKDGMEPLGKFGAPSVLATEKLTGCFGPHVNLFRATGTCVGLGAPSWIPRDRKSTRLNSSHRT